QLRQQGEEAELTTQVLIEKVSAMAAGFKPLGDHRIDAAFLQPQRFVQRGGAGQDFRAAAPYALQKSFLRQTEMETDHRRAELFHQGCCFVVEWQAPRPA